MKAIATYQRVSKEEQSRDTDAFIRQGWQLDCQAAKYPDRERLAFSDIQSGRKDNRPDMLKLVGAIESGRIDILIVTRIDRIGRDLEANARLQKQLERKKVLVFEILLGRFLEWDNPNDWDYFVKSGLDGEKESRMLSKRVRQTFEWHRAQGKMGGGRVGFPYRRDKDGFIEPHPKHWEIAIECIKIAIAHRGATTDAIIQIREQFGLDRTRAWLYQWLRSPLLRGHTPQWTKDEDGNKKSLSAIDIVPNTHISLFSDPRLNGTEKQLDRIIQDCNRLKGSNRSRPVYPLSGLVWCARCDRPCHIKSICNPKYPTIRYTYVMCGDRLNRGIGCGGEYGAFMGRKGTINTTYELVEHTVIMTLIDTATELVNLSLADRTTEQPEDPQIAELKSQIGRLKSFEDPDLESAIAKKNAQLNELLLASVDESIPATTRQEFIELFSTPDVFLGLSDVEKRTLYRDWVSKVSIDRQNVKVLLAI